MKPRVAALILYFLMLHAMLGVVIINPYALDNQRWRLGITSSEPSPYVLEMQQYFRAIDYDATAGRLVLIGDSHFQRMDVNLLDRPSLNYSAGGDTVFHMKSRIKEYISLNSAAAVVVWGGFNDLDRRPPRRVAKDMSILIDTIPPGPKVFLLNTPPVATNRLASLMNARIRELNSSYADLCANPCRLVDIYSELAARNGVLAPEYDSGDGLHLNAKGYRIVASILNRALEGDLR